MTWTRYVQAISVLAFVIFFIITAPSFASAAEVSVQTAQLLPVGGNTCAPAGVSGFTPYVYNGSLHAFEFTVADSSYVAIAATVGSTNIPFNQMTRRGEASGAVRIHGDLQSLPVQRGLPISVTMLSAKGSGQPVCITTVATTVTTDGELSITPPAGAPKPVPPPVSTTAPKPKPAPAPAPTPTPASKAPTSTAAKPTTTATSAAFATTQSILKGMCAGTGADRLWFVLLALFAAVVAFAVFGQSQLPPALRTQEWTAAAIVVPFLLLFGLWYFVESCRTTPWVPVIATIVALAGLGIAFWERGTKRPMPSQTVINLPGAKK
ncbi:MAG: hypothetical protein HY422_01480 [Candidatus Komeilibacteria bacterium]|nr:hypothetical protein [Candidatus Komeilibacteria bacterium]